VHARHDAHVTCSGCSDSTQANSSKNDLSIFERAENVLQNRRSHFCVYTFSQLSESCYKVRNYFSERGIVENIKILNKLKTNQNTFTTII